MLRVMDQLIFSNGVLYRKRISQGQPFHQLVLPMKYRKTALENLHDAVGHLGIDRTLDLVRARFYWPHMAMDVSEKVRTCERCIRRKAQTERSAPLVNIKTSRPLELVCMDYLSLEPDGKGTKNILVITDHFTKYAVAVPTVDQKSKTVAKALWSNFFIHYGFPQRLHSDQGRDFESALIKDLCALLGIKKTRTTPYHPRGNPVERFNRTLLEMLGTLEEGDKVRWRDFVQPLVHAYNCTKNDTTGFSPYQLMFGRQPRLPLDIAFGLDPERNSKLSHSEYVKRLTEHLTESYRLATENSLKNALQNKQRFDSKVRESTLAAGDKVLVRNVGIRGKHKIADRWSETIYVVVKQFQDSPVYVVVPDSTDGPERVLHRDLLLPCGFLPSAVKDIQPKMKSKERPKKPSHSEPERAEDNEELSEVEDEDEYYSLFDEHSTFRRNVLASDNQRQEETPQLGEHIEENSELLDNQETNVSLDVSTLNPAAATFKAVNINVDKGSEAVPVFCSPVPEPNKIETATQDLLDSPTMDLSRDRDPRNGRQPDSELIEGAGDVQEQNESESVDIAPETQVPIRRSVRDKTAPKRLTYPTLGNPLVMVMHSILAGLDQALSQTFDSMPYIGQLEPLASEVV
uniref:Gypsy retrotransposon integrase-like protein 1 n=1 Tax=Denticeps clupeoides TaxID=299321 RepID=A0AAY4C9X6_9TELE